MIKSRSGVAPVVFPRPQPLGQPALLFCNLQMELLKPCRTAHVRIRREV